MCVIIYKPIGKLLPKESILEKCFNANKDGAGYMLPINNKVVIHKGFMDFNSFIESIKSTIIDNNINVEKTPIVIHFRITTQGGVQKELCHPYPICDNYDNMRKLDNECNIALAHNGIIFRCSEHSYGGEWDSISKKWVRKEQPKYNDTMTYIKDYANLIIDNDLYFARNSHKCELLERLCENSKLAIMNYKGFVKLIGQFSEINGIYYSNTYAFDKPKTNISFKSTKEILSDRYDFGDFIGKGVDYDY